MASTTTGTSLPTDQAPSADGETSAPWLDEVRAQRQAWETRRDAARAKYEAQRRLNNPRSAAHQEAWEEGVRRRRAEHLERIEQDRELFHGLAPGQLPNLWRGNPTPPSDNLDSTGFPSLTHPMYSPPGWDNPWYFRGF